MNIRRGLFRLWIALSLPWWAITGWLIFDANRQSEEWSNYRYELLEDRRKFIGEDGNFRQGTDHQVKELDEEIEVALGRMAEEYEAYEFYIAYLPLIPIGFGFLLLLGFWVTQGFRRKE